MLLIIGIFLAIFFGVTLLYGAPYLPTLKKSSKEVLDILEVKPGQTIIDLGSGDGAFLLEAAKRGVQAYGYELSLLLVLISKIRCFKYRKQITIKWANYWNVKLPKETDFVYVFLLKRFMPKLDQYLNKEAKRLGKPLTLASYTFKVPNKKVIRKTDSVFVYKYR